MSLTKRQPFFDDFMRHQQEEEEEHYQQLLQQYQQEEDAMEQEAKVQPAPKGSHAHGGSTVPTGVRLSPQILRRVKDMAEAEKVSCNHMMQDLLWRGTGMAREYRQAIAAIVEQLHHHEPIESQVQKHRRLFCHLIPTGEGAELSREENKMVSEILRETWRSHAQD